MSKELVEALYRIFINNNPEKVLSELSIETLLKCVDEQKEINS